MLRQIVLFLCVMFCFASVRAAEFLDQSEFLMKVGDDLRWAQPSWDDRDWPEVQFQLVPQANDIVWFRAKIRLLPGHFIAEHPLGVYFAALASHEIYWDVFLIGRGGKPARVAQNEVPGPIQTHYVLPERLATPGVHTIAIRTLLTRSLRTSVPTINRKASRRSIWGEMEIERYPAPLNASTA